MSALTAVKGLGLRFLETVPEVSLAFAYGSGVFLQPRTDCGPSENRALPQVDFIFAVDDPIIWHRENLSSNADHYGGLSRLGSRWVDFVATSVGVGVHFNAFVPFADKVLKYGIVSVQSLREDLTSWRHLYISGRLHKPVLWIKKEEKLREEIASNAQAALAAALILAPSKFSNRELFHRICGLSYTGDIRTHLAEDRAKIDRIVAGSFEEFCGLYEPFVQGEVGKTVELHERADGCMTMDVTQKRRLLSFLPESVSQEFPFEGGEVFRDDDQELYLMSVLSKRVAASSRKQALAGLLGSGLKKSSVYLMHKLQKAGYFRRTLF